MSEQEIQGGINDTGLKFKPVFFAVVSLGIIFFLYQIVGGGITLYMFGAIPGADRTLAFRLITMAAEILFILVPTVLLTRVQTSSWKSFLRYRKTDWYYIALAVIGVVALQQLLEIYLYLQSLIPLPSSWQEIIKPFQQAIDHTYKVLISAHNPLDFLFVLAVVALTPAICEESLFRGLVQGNFENAMTKKKAIVWTGLVFGAYHLDPFSFVALGALGIYLSYLASSSGSILVPMAAHFTNNFLSALVYYLWQKDSIVAPSGEKGVNVAYIIVWSVALGLIFAMTVYLTSNHNKVTPEANET